MSPVVDMTGTYLFFGFGGGVRDIVRLAILMSSSRFSSQSGLAGAVFRLPGYALVSVSSKYPIVSGKVLKNKVPSQASANIRSHEYIPYSQNMAFAWSFGIQLRHSRK